ncbi:ABC transporter ATP-binding protein [Paenibacillus sp. TRM 82003]|uniref:ABC transporter ATP-binding protein n=1 Tax=Kineococcus sp. TRM81007 TaxID=2925831 RepID=UPI001F5916FE|nr:ABC transporter ATP-binding protein [Kineococcus sp. TRM81007]MCI2237861.1 ABC transporter ATP-binding protein [Kineococcus sp. TRM81007]MCI3924592.1 ABC transporter ATP-binding protein [Paenibacillus sp. TRM 82003]
MSEPVLVVEDLRVQLDTPRGNARIVNGLSYSVAPGETVAVVGESGSGKSVSVMALLGLLPKRARVTGSARFRGRDLLTMRERELRAVRGDGVGMVFQDPMTSLNPVLTIGRQLTEGLLAHRKVSGKREARERAAQLLADVGLPDPRGALDRFPHELSGGMRQRVVIATALAGDPALLIADEATTALDVTVQAQILDLVARLQDEHRTGVVWITHDLGVVAGVADRVLVMYGGRCVEDGTVDDVFERPAHPYTQGLLGSLPQLHDGGAGGSRELVAIGGTPPPPTDLPPGCVFWPRCPVRGDERCATEQPPLTPVGPRDGAGAGSSAVPHRAATFYDAARGAGEVGS